MKRTITMFMTAIQRNNSKWSVSTEDLKESIMMTHKTVKTWKSKAKLVINRLLNYSCHKDHLNFIWTLYRGTNSVRLRWKAFVIHLYRIHSWQSAYNGQCYQANSSNHFVPCRKLPLLKGTYVRGRLSEGEY